MNIDPEMKPKIEEAYFSPRRESHPQVTTSAEEKVKQNRNRIINVLVKHSMIYTELEWTDISPTKKRGCIKYLSCPGLTLEEIAVKIEIPMFVVQGQLDKLIKYGSVEAVTKDKIYYRLRQKVSPAVRQTAPKQTPQKYIPDIIVCAMLLWAIF